MQRTDSLEKTPMLGKIEGGRRRGQQRMRRLDGITDSMDVSPSVCPSSRSKLQELVMDVLELSSLRSQALSKSGPWAAGGGRSPLKAQFSQGAGL